MRIGLVLICAVLLTATPALAALGVHFGYGKAIDSDGGSTFIGGHLEVPVPVIPFLSVQGAIDYRHVETLEVDVPGADGEVDVRSIPITVTARAYMSTGSRMDVFGALGAGWYYLSYDYSGLFATIEDDSDMAFGWHLGAGVQIDLVGSAVGYLEGRAIFSDPDRDFGADLRREVGNFDYDSTYFAVGVTFGM